MLYIYTEHNLCKKRFIEDVEAFFEFHLSDIINKIGSVKNIILDIDRATLLDKDVIRTRFGVTNLMNLSSGCKVVIISILYPQYCINYTEAGYNIFSYVLGLSNKKDLTFYITKFCVAKDMSAKICVNNKMITVKDFCVQMARCRG